MPKRSSIKCPGAMVSLSQWWQTVEGSSAMEWLRVVLLIRTRIMSIAMGVLSVASRVMSKEMGEMSMALRVLSTEVGEISMALGVMLVAV